MHLDEPSRSGHGSGFAAHTRTFCLVSVSILAPWARFRLALQGYLPALTSRRSVVDLPYRGFGTALGRRPYCRWGRRRELFDLAVRMLLGSSSY